MPNCPAAPALRTVTALLALALGFAVLVAVPAVPAGAQERTDIIREPWSQPGPNQLTVGWQAPRDPAFNRVIVRAYEHDGQPHAWDKGEIIARGSLRSVTLTHLGGAPLKDATFYVVSVIAYTNDYGRQGDMYSVHDRTAYLTRIASSRTPEVVEPGKPVTIRGRLERYEPGEGSWLTLPDRPLALWARAANAGEFTRVATTRTTDGIRTPTQGTFSFTHTPSMDTEYEVRYAGYAIERGTSASLQASDVRAASQVAQKPARRLHPAWTRTDRRVLAGDWNRDGRDTVGVRRGTTWSLRNSNSAGDAHLRFSYGRAGDVPLVGDWNGDGRDTIGVRRGTTFLLRNSNSAGAPHRTFDFGSASDVPVVGDWNGDGRDTIGVRRGTDFLLRTTNSAGRADVIRTYGRTIDRPVAGDWTRSGRDTIGAVRRTTWRLRGAAPDGGTLIFAY